FGPGRSQPERLTGMRLKARPRPVAEKQPWRLSALTLRWARPAIRRFDWELRPGAWGQLTALLSWPIATLAYRPERGRPEGPPALWFPSFANKGTASRAESIGSLS